MAHLKITKEFIHLRGTDAMRFVNGMLSADVKWMASCKPSTGRAYFLTPKGRIVSELQVFVRNEGDIILALFEEDFERVYSELEKFIIADDVEIKKSTEFENTVIEILDESILMKPLELFQNSNRNKFSLEKTYQVAELENCWCLPKNLWGAHHLELWKKKGNSSSLYQKWLAQEALEEKTWKTLRFQKAHPRWRVEIHPEAMPVEFPLADAFSFDKGCYRGQESVNMATFRGKPAQVLVMLESSGSLASVLPGAELFKESSKIGCVLSVYQNQAFALLRRAIAERAPGELLLQSGERVHVLKVLVDEKSYRGER